MKMTTDSKPGDSDAPSADAPKDADKTSLNDVLASWDDGESKGSATDDAMAGMSDKAKLDLLMKRQGDVEDRNELERIVPVIKGDLNIPSDIVEGYVRQRAINDQRLNDLWINRDTRRAEFDQAVQALATEFQGALKPKSKAEPKPDKGLAAAVHSAREVPAGDSGFDSVDWANLSDSEFQVQKSLVYKAAELGQLK
jgi:hypothetical protein